MKCRPIPKGLDILDRPDIDDRDEFYLAAFWKLSTCRAYGLSSGPIPWRDIVAFAMDAGLDEYNRAVFGTVILEMDRGYLSLEAAELRKPAAPPRPPTTPSTPAGKRIGGGRG